MKSLWTVRLNIMTLAQPCFSSMLLSRHVIKSNIHDCRAVVPPAWILSVQRAWWGCCSPSTSSPGPRGTPQPYSTVTRMLPIRADIHFIQPTPEVSGVTGPQGISLSHPIAGIFFQRAFFDSTGEGGKGVFPVSTAVPPCLVTFLNL